ncbi:MAG: LPS export ABC transporter permease LptG [Caldithrix sp.]|nr:LPS export ABC transporter permease LptG [Caldithrix sp.]
MFRFLDQYILRQFLINLLIAVITWIIIFLVVDIIENISDFIDNGASVSQFAQYYLYYIPYIISLTLPVAVLLSVLFTMSMFANHNEVVAQLSSGISLYRILLPLFLMGLLISTGAGFFNEWVVPRANEMRFNLKRYEIKGHTPPSSKSRSNLFRQDTGNRRFAIKYYNGETQTAKGVSIQTFRGRNLVERIDASRMIWKEKHWLLKEGSVRRFKGQTEKLYQFTDSTIADIRLQPKDMLELQKKPEEMSYSELNYFIKEIRSVGGEVRKWLVERHLKIAMPFANFIVILLGAPLASRRRRGGMGVNFGISLLVSFTYFIIIRFGQVLGHQGKMDPLLGAWLGNLIFIVLGLYSLLSVRK